MSAWILILVPLICFLTYHRASLWISTVALATCLIALGRLDLLNPFCLTVLLSILLVAAIPLNLPFLRRRICTDRLFRWFGQNLPSMSATEREALEAGTVWWDAELFSGRPNWKKLRSVKKPKLASKEAAFLKGPVEELCGMLDDWRITEHLNDLPAEVWTFLRQKGFFGMIIPKRYGGLEFSAQAHSAVIMKVASRSITAAVTVMVPNSLGPAELLLNYGTDKQKDFYLPRLARGEEIPCFALTGPEAGSDAASMPDTGVICRGDFGEEQDVPGIRLNWEKRYITLGPLATLLGLAFKLFDPDHLLGEKEGLGITLALIPTDLPGIRIGSRHFPLNAAFQVGPTWGTNVFIPLDFIIGGPDRAGQGWKMLMECLAAGRSISLPALSTGSGKLASRVIGAYARIRRQFKMPIGRFEGVETALARIGGNTYLMDAARALTAQGVDRGEKPSVISAMAKYNLTERARKVINDAMDVQGGSAVCMGPRNLLGRIYQSLPISITVEGSNTLTRSMIVFGQGAIRCHPYLLREIEAVQGSDPKQGRKAFDKALMGHIGFLISNAVRSLVLGLTGSRPASVPGPAAARPYYRGLSRMCAAFAFTADLSLIILGPALKRKEKLSGRLADIFSQLYLISAALKHFEDQGAAGEDLPLLRWACEDSLHIIQESFDGLLRNFPNRPAARVLRFLIFPWGSSFPPPGDRLEHEVAEILLAPAPARDRLTAGIYLPAQPGEPLAGLEDALLKVMDAEPVEGKIRRALREGRVKADRPEQALEGAVPAGIINREEMDLVRSAEAAMREVIRVDDFPRDQWNRERGGSP